MSEIQLPFWLAGEQLDKLRKAAEAYWQQMNEHVDWTNRQIDALTCHPDILELLAWDRDIVRFTKEPEQIFRLRVKHAYANAKDAGSVAGFADIFLRLGVRYLQIRERSPGLDWDIVTIELEDGDLSQQQGLLEALIQHYGRTCRRYQFLLSNLAERTIGIGTATLESQDSIGYMPVAYTVENQALATAYSAEHGATDQTHLAQPTTPITYSVDDQPGIFFAVLAAGHDAQTHILQM